MKEKIINLNFEDVLAERFARYSKYIIQERALPDLRDGLKPVQRRILYSMFIDKNTHSNNFRKSAKTVGNVIGNFHPHGDSSVYDSLVRMSQTWKMRYPLVNMHGNNGSIDGDSPAAMRYTESKLMKISDFLFTDLKKETVEYISNFDDTNIEPKVLPVYLPMLLLNGSTGISSGYATNIPPHNLNNVIDALSLIIDDEDVDIEKIITKIKGPDFPTGGIISNYDGLVQAYKTGNGRIKITATIQKEKNKIIITEIPYEVNKSELIKKIDEIRFNKKIDGIKKVIDESDRNGLKISIECAANKNIDIIEKFLLKNTNLSVNYSLNMIAIVDKKPKILNIKEILSGFLNFQKEIFTRKFDFELKQLKNKKHINDALIKVISILDKIISLIRKSKGKQDAKEQLIKKYDFSEIQAESIVSLRLYRLSNTDVNLIIDENKNIQKNIKLIENIIKSDKNLLEYIKNNLLKLKEEFGDKRKTLISKDNLDLEIKQEELVSDENFKIILFKDGFFKKLSQKSYENLDLESQIYQNSALQKIVDVNNKNKLLIITKKGYFGILPVFKINELKNKDSLDHISNYVQLEDSDEVFSIFELNKENENKNLIVASKLSKIRKTKINNFSLTKISKTSNFFKLTDQDQVADITIANDNDFIISINSDNEMLKYLESEIPLTKGKSAGVKNQRIKNNQKIISITSIPDDFEINCIFANGYVSKIHTAYIPLKFRSQSGKKISSKNIISKITIQNKINVFTDKNESLNLENLKIENPPIKGTKKTKKIIFLGE